MTETIAKLRTGTKINLLQVDALIDAYCQRGSRPFDEDEVDAYLRTGILDVTNWNNITIEIGVSQTQDGSDWSDSDTIDVVFSSQIHKIHPND